MDDGNVNSPDDSRPLEATPPLSLDYVAEQKRMPSIPRAIGNVIKAAILLPVAFVVVMTGVAIFNQREFDREPALIFIKLLVVIAMAVFVLWLLTMLLTEGVCWLRGIEPPASKWYKIWARFDGRRRL